MKQLLLTVLFLTGATSALGQTTISSAEQCRLSMAEAPAIRGIRLRMDIDQVLAAFPGAENDSELRARLVSGKFGFQSVTFSPAKYDTSEKFTGIQLINLSFLDGRLAHFQIGYNGPEWRGTAQFAARVAEVLKLPGVDLWKASSYNGLALTCSGFELSVQTGSPTNWIGMKDLSVDINKVINERQEVPKEQARKAFVP